MLIIYTTISVSNSPLRSPHLHLHRWVTKGEEKRGARSENWGSRAGRGRSSMKEEVERSEKKSWWISCLNKWRGGKLFDQWAVYPLLTLLRLGWMEFSLHKQNGKCNFPNLNTSCSMWIPCVKRRLIMNKALYILTVFKLFQRTSMEGKKINI